MTLARSVAEVLADHVTLEVECIDRMYLNLYVPKLQYETGVVGFFRNHLGYSFASSALMDPITKGFVKDIEGFCKDQRVDLVTFEKGQRKDDLAHEYLADFEGDEGVLFVGKAQEKTTTFRTEKRKNPDTGKTYPWIVRATALVNQYYFYCVDKDFGPFFIKFSSYFPYNAKLCINGNEWAKCQAAHAGVDFEPLDNGFASCKDQKRLQAICERLSDKKIDALARKWFARLPHPFTGKDRRAGYRYDISILQAELSLTQVLDRPLTGRVFFEEVIRDNLDLGRPDQVSLIFARRVTRRTPGRFRTRVITVGVTPSLHVDYKHAKIKQYHKEGQALRTETTINDTRDFGVGRRLHNLPRLREIGFSANRDLRAVQRTSADCHIKDAAFEEVCAPVVSGNQRGPAMRFGDPPCRSTSAPSSSFVSWPTGSPATSCEHISHHSRDRSERHDRGQDDLDLRALRLHGLIEAICHTNSYQVTRFGLQVAMFFTRSYNRLLRSGLSELCDPLDIDTPLRRHFDRLESAITDLVQEVNLAA